MASTTVTSARDAAHVGALLDSPEIAGLPCAGMFTIRRALKATVTPIPALGAQDTTGD